ncbi:PREDICTED: F-box/LRR-repeat protein 3 [Nelumbo nucifera]|uniref:F-box/LRR-repeat protein 3 n=2 Tax=Nelumbo nucifera TaxID=4432 RepID=A0A1U8AP95_NELNU|nr:PREDICTED: F-box/LRR-repeat protein 3 [Nelumbo nucifera]XP_010269607.1 PREDICTED: F-box/LRR-repeat protein 3 [Nelumbo nucifera]DAD33241.1 TPA_asm: hypothetical protein HUJ06_012092 [Nelumbo nucifera]
MTITMKKPKSTIFIPSPSLLTVLTEDLLLRVLDNLIDSSHRKAWRLVCKCFLRLESLHRKALRVFRHDSLPNLLRRYRLLELLDLSVCPRVDDGTIAFSFGAEPGGFCWTRRLTKLVLSRACGLRSSGLEVVVKSCPSLQEIDLSYCLGLGDREASALSRATGLRDLKLVKCLGVTDVGLAKIAIGCTKLERLSLKWCLEITDLGIELLSKKSTGLRSLDISYLKVTNNSLHSISYLRKLESLSVVGCSFVDDDGLLFLRNRNPHLQSIDVSRCENVTLSGLISVVEGHEESLLQLGAGYCCSEFAAPFLNQLKELRNLKSIRIDGARVDDFSLGTIGANCKHLVEVGLSKCAGVTDGGIAELVVGHANLKVLDLTCCHLITDASLSAISAYCTKLVCLKLESCDLITQKGLEQLGSSCSLLEELDLTDCSGVTDMGLKCLSTCSELLYLKLGLCVNISDKGLQHVASKCTKLRELDLYRCTGIGDDGLAAVSTGCKKLKKLNLSYCMEVSDRGLKYISNLSDLQDLEMRRLLKISSEGLMAIAVGCKSLSELDIKRCYNIDDVGLLALAQYACNLRQINLSYCPVSDAGLFMAMRNLKCLQDAKLVHLAHVSLEGYELALRVSCGRLKKLKLVSTLKDLLSSNLLQILKAQGCKIRWMEKALILV